MERYEVVATIKVGFDNDNLEAMMRDLVQLLAYHDVLCPEDKYKAAIVGDSVIVICSYSHGEAC